MSILDTLTKSLVDVYAKDLSPQEQKDLVHALEVLADDQKYNRFQNFFPDTGEFRRELYPKHTAFFSAGTEFMERGFIAANRIGKSEAGAFEVTCHATGNYPAWWDGHRITHPCLIWVGGDTATTVRDIIQKKLVGPDINDMGAGMIPKENIIIEKCKTRRNVPEALEIIKVRHISGGESTIVLKTYEQGRATWQGTEVDFIWVDEECPNDVYGEALIRIMTTKGRIITTFTPLQGLTDLVLSFLEQSQDTDVEDPVHVTIVAWDDVPHLGEDEKRKILARTPPQLRDARSKGIPTVGEGLVYPIDPKFIIVEDFQIPKFFKKAYGMDVGWNMCVAKDSMVMLPDGTSKAIQDIEEGEKVLAFDFKTEALIPTNVISTFKGYAENMVTTGISDEQQITCTDDHPFAHRAAAKDKIKFKDIKDIKARIREFQSVVLPSKWEPDETKDICSPEMARVLGYLLGDGGLTYLQNNRRISFAQKTKEYVDDMRSCLESVGCKMSNYGSESTYYLSGIDGGTNNVLEFVRKLQLIGTDSKTKFIPKEFFLSTKEVISNLLVGLIHTDGTVEKDHCRIYTVSKEMADGIKILCLRLGIYASISVDNRKRKASHNDVYRVTLRRPKCLPLLYPKTLVATRPERKKRFDRLIDRYEEAPSQDIYCITVDHPDHAFVCNGFVVSNTAALWGAWDIDNDIIYIYSEHGQGLAEPIIHAEAIKARGAWIKGQIDPHARDRAQRDGEKLFDDYVKHGLKIYPANNAVEAGIFDIWERFTTGRLKIFASCTGLLRELSLYHRDEKGKIVKKNDHKLDCLRYLNNAPPSAWSYPEDPIKARKVVDIGQYMNACI